MNNFKIIFNLRKKISYRELQDYPFSREQKGIIGVIYCIPIINSIYNIYFITNSSFRVEFAIFNGFISILYLACLSLSYAFGYYKNLFQLGTSGVLPISKLDGIFDSVATFILNPFTYVVIFLSLLTYIPFLFVFGLSRGIGIIILLFTMGSVFVLMLTFLLQILDNLFRINHVLSQLIKLVPILFIAFNNNYKIIDKVPYSIFSFFKVNLESFTSKLRPFTFYGVGLLLIPCMLILCIVFYIIKEKIDKRVSLIKHRRVGHHSILVNSDKLNTTILLSIVVSILLYYINVEQEEIVFFYYALVFNLNKMPLNCIVDIKSIKRFLLFPVPLKTIFTGIFTKQVVYSLIAIVFPLLLLLRINSVYAPYILLHFAISIVIILPLGIFTSVFYPDKTHASGVYSIISFLVILLIHSLYHLNKDLTLLGLTLVFIIPLGIIAYKKWEIIKSEFYNNVELY
jgi:hypothetical protein